MKRLMYTVLTTLLRIKRSHKNLDGKTIICDDYV